MKGKMKTPVMEFHISRKSRERYGFDEALFSLSGNVIFPNFHGARIFAQKINDQRDLTRFPEQAVRAGEIHAMGLIDEILHYVVGLFRDEKNPRMMEQALDCLLDQLGRSRVEETLRKFAEEFPGVALYREEIDLQAFLEGQTGGVPHRQIILEEMLMLWLANANPAFAPFSELFDDTLLKKETSYLEIIETLRSFFRDQPFFGPDHQDLIDMLRSPAIASPHSLSGQLDYIRERWGFLLGRYLRRLLTSLDFLKEDELAEWRRMTHWSRLPAPVIEFAGMEGEPERFSHDLDWMPRLVLMAKNIYVWLDQLSGKYRRPLNRLDQIPDEELDLLSSWGFTGLWLIGVWERSKASKRIKQIMGNPEAEASAYSLFDYQIAQDLGGDEALQQLKDRAWSRGIRLASDMVPNHVGIDSKWVVEHPDWFISLDYSPFPVYRYDGPDLSWHGEVGIFLEDHYYDRSDAAVVFKRLDRKTGTVKHIFHGNDGTHMPWNDTAQLNYLKEEVREAVIQTILHVARKFPIIRFDAAMTLTKRHYQRLWFPAPGAGGVIPSRADQGLTRDEFDRAMPEEFWRQVVDRVARDAPDTLLLAEAFWLLEGYFVRTLGMHRVYNSAFMNMLKDEENAKYRSVMKNTLEFDPEVLKRFLNFMNNPDEETAVAQFGKGDKYFGVCTMMVTLPGLPMFGHGQLEGFNEKYGMEYRFAKWKEEPDQDLLFRHEKEIFPLLRRRYLFAQVQNFLLYDFYTPDGYVNENVFAYSNRSGLDRALIVYHNKYEATKGWIRSSVAYSFKGNGEERKLVQKDLGEGLALRSDPRFFCAFRDHINGLVYLRSSLELREKGLCVELGAYQHHVFLDFFEIQDNEEHHYARLTAYLNGRGVASLEQAMKEMLLQPLHHAFRDLTNSDLFRQLIDTRSLKGGRRADQEIFDDIEQRVTHFYREASRYSGGIGDEGAMGKEVRQTLEAILRLPATPFQLPRPAAKYLKENLVDSPPFWVTLLSWLFIRNLGNAETAKDITEQGLRWMDDWELDRILDATFRDFGLDGGAIQRKFGIIKCLIRHQKWHEGTSIRSRTAYQVIDDLLRDEDVQSFLQVNRHNEILWFNRESFEELLWWLFLVAVIEISSHPGYPARERVKEVERSYSIIQALKQAEEKSEYQVGRILSLLRE